MFVAVDAIVEGDFTGQTAFGEQLERAVDSGVADAGIFFLNEAVQFVGGKVVAGFEKRAQDRVALRRLLEADTFEVAVKNRLGLDNHLPRDGGLVVDALLEDALLQHEGSG